MSPVLFATKPYQYLAQRLLDAAPAALEAGVLTIRDFPDGEHYHCIDTSVRGRHVWVVGGTTDDAATMELFDIAQGCVQYGAFSLTIIIPYFGYSTMERSVAEGEIVKAKNRALLFSSIPRTPLGNRIILFDLHAEGIPYYFDSNVQPHHIYCEALHAANAGSLANGESFVLAATDAGRAKWVESMANKMGVQGAFIYKRRHSAEETEVLAVNANVQGSHVIIYDDMIRTGGSLLEAAKAYRQEGAARISVLTTHGLFTANAMGRISSSGIIEKIIALDTHPAAVHLQHPLLEVRSVAPLIINRLLDDDATGS
jgi:ribose-phosphate pyrophosphokinase